MNGFDQLEDRGVRADAKGERQQRDEREPRIAAKRARAISHVAERVVDPHRAPHVAARLLLLIHAAKRQRGRTTGSVGRHTVRDVLGDLTIEMEPQLLVELRLHTRRSKQRPDA